MKRIIIMGATSGIGRGVAEAYARAGWLVGACGRNREQLDALRRAYPEQIHTARIDITSHDAPSQLLALIETLGGMDIYFHASGIFRENPALNLKDELDVIATNVTGFTAMITTTYRFFRRIGLPGQIAAITSVAGTRGISDMAAYSASKSFDSNYLEALAQMAHRDGYPIAITDIRPGWTRTALLDPTRKYPMTMAPEAVIAQTIRAIMERKPVAIIDWRWNLLVKAWRRLPRCVWTRMPIHPSSSK